jgi:hypothetical protein
MTMMHPRPGPHPVHTLHRVSAAAIGAFLSLFGVLGLIQRLPLFTTSGTQVLGLSSNGLLAAISLLVGATLIVSAVIGGNTASTISIVLGGLFVLSGFVNAVVLGTEMNLLAFRLSNILFSLVVGSVLLITGSWGRITGRLPVDNPYHRDVPEDADSDSAREHPDHVVDAAELAEAERAYALHYATSEQLERLAKVWVWRSAEDRERAWHDSAARSDS